MTQSFLVPRFDNFKSFDTVNLLATHRYEAYNQHDDLKHAVLPPTAQNEKTTEYEKYSTRSIKILAQPLDISFEQNFMEQHYHCFDKELQKYMEHQQNSFSFLLSEALTKKIFSINSVQRQSSFLVSKIRQNSQLLSQIQIQRLIIDLKRQDKLNEFLSNTLRKINDELIKEFLLIVKEIWEQWIIIQQMNYTFEQTIQFGQNFTSKYLQTLDQKLTYLNYKYAQNQNKNKISSTQKKQRLNQLRKFLTFYSTTIALVIGGYFQNPYSSGAQNYFKRQLNQFGLCLQNDDSYKDKDFQDSQGQDQNYFHRRDKRIKN